MLWNRSFKSFQMQIVMIQTHDLYFKMQMGKMILFSQYSCLLQELWSLNVLAGDSKKSINSTKSIKIIDSDQEMVLTRGFGLPFMRFWVVRYWHNPQSASIYQVSVILMLIQNPITCTIFRKSSVRSYRCTYKL